MPAARPAARRSAWGLPLGRQGRSQAGLPRGRRHTAMPYTVNTCIEVHTLCYERAWVVR